MINIRNFFEIDTNDVPVKKPINRNAFTPADVAYKVKYIKAMLDLGMIVTIDTDIRTELKEERKTKG